MEEKQLRIIKEHNEAINGLKALIEEYEDMKWVPAEELLPLVSKLQRLRPLKGTELSSTGIN